jgi:hypothetical protein
MEDMGDTTVGYSNHEQTSQLSGPTDQPSAKKPWDERGNRNADARGPRKCESLPASQVTALGWSGDASDSTYAWERSILSSAFLCIENFEI